MINQKLRNYSLIREIALYGIIGGICSTVDSISFIMLTSISINTYISNFISINIGIIFSFILNTYINFKKTDKILKRAVSFFKIGYIGMILSMLIMYIGTNIGEFNEIKVKLISIILVAIFQFIMNKIFTFKNIKNNKEIKGI